MSDHPLVTLAKSVQYDLTSAKAKLSELERQIAALDLAPAGQHVCDDCGIGLPSLARLSEHSYLTHDGAEPAHWRTAESLAATE